MRYMKINIKDALETENLKITAQIKLVLMLSLPAIMAELSSIVMQYIDAGMVGSLGANATAAIGLVSSSTWLIGGLCIGAASGFSVQVAQLIGAGMDEEARNVLRQAVLSLLLFSLVVAGIGLSISSFLPIWLGGDPVLYKESSRYFAVYCAAIPFAQMNHLSGAMLQCSGDLKTPSILNTALCFLDVILNLIFIFPTRTISVLGFKIQVYGAGMGVFGAAIGTALSEVIIATLMTITVFVFSPKLKLKNGGSWKFQSRCIKTALKLAIPMSVDHTFTCGAYVAGTLIIAPLGSVALAANSLAITAESLCYMPAYGIRAAAISLVGQSLGAGKKDLTRSFARCSVYLGMIIMSIMAVIMYIFAPHAFALLTNDPSVIRLGTTVLRMELIAEPLYGASIVASGAFRGAGDTLFPSILNLVSMWGVRITSACFLVPIMGLKGYWLAMCVELCVRGILFLIRLYREKWIKKALYETT